MDSPSRITNLMARSPALAGITLSAVGIAVFGVERMLLPAGAAGEAVIIASRVLIIGMLGLAGWLLGRLAVRNSSDASIAYERSRLLPRQERNPADGDATVTPMDSSEQRKRENIRLALYNILDATTRSQTLEELLVSIHEQVKTVMRAHNFFVAMYDASCDRYSFLYRADEFDSFPLNTPLDLRGGLTDLVRTSGTPKLENRDDIETRVGEGSVRLLGRRSESWLGVPFPSGSDVGVVVVQTYTPGSPFTLNDQDALLAISGQIGLAIERKRAGEEIANRRQLMERILDNSSMGFAINNTDSGEVLYVNDAFPRIYRVSRDACANVSVFFEAVYGRQAELGQRILDDVLSGDADRMAWEDVELIDANGETFHVSARNITLPEQRLVISTVLDVTAQVRMRVQQAELENRMQLTQKMESVGVLAGGIAHDFNNLLTAILGNLDLARSETNPAERAELLDQASSACVDASNLTRQLLTFSRGGEPVRKAAYIKHLISDTVGFALRGSNVKANFQLDEALSAVEVDEGQLKQVIHNLIANAKQAMPNGGLVEVHAANSTRRDSTTGGVDPIVRISVRDSGTGISPANLPRIFEPYFTTRQKGSGTGLGLATAFSIIRRHSGTLSVESTPGQGTVFFIELPASVQPVVRPDTQFVAGVNGGGNRILVMDDEGAIRKLTEKMLLACGYQCESVPDGAAALRAYEAAIHDQRPFAAVILDLTIPGGMGGRETFAGLKAIHPGVIAIVSSGYSDTNESSEYQAMGFAASLQKPFSRNDLVRTLTQVLSRD